jgi:hypothetical protein
MKQLIQYRTIARYKYELIEPYLYATGIHVSMPIETRYIALRPGGLLKIKEHYAWDGASGPAIETTTNRRASLVHDALYQLMRLGLLSYSWRKKADKIYWRICLEDGMNKRRARLHYWALRLFGRRFAGN